MPVGAEWNRNEGVRFRVWAPRRKQVDVVLESGSGATQTFSLQREESGYFSAVIATAAPGNRYRYCLDGSTAYPDPASRFQPEGPHGPSEIVDPGAFDWSDHSWPGLHLRGQVIYEMHIGTFTKEGTWSAARQELPELARAGITALELLPIAEFPGRFGWGYDGVDLFAPTRLYGTPTDLRHFINDAHALGLGVILDVVYNHLGPDGNYLKEFTPDYFSAKYENEWGEPINFDGPNSVPVREFFCCNAAYWIAEYHMDGLRLDATQQIFDSSAEHIIRELTRHARDAAGGKSILIVAENEKQETVLIRLPEQGGYGLDAVWNDDFHHGARAAVTGRNEAYYTDYHGSPQELISACKRGYLYQGQWYSWQRQRRGTPTRGLKASQFITYIQNHDQVANSGNGRRLDRLTDLGRLKAITALLLLAPGTPMLFQGQEFAASAPFLYFADHMGELPNLVRKGRRKFLSQFRSLATPKMQSTLTDPCAASTFEICKLDFSDRQRNEQVYDLHRDLLRLRREDPVFRLQGESGFDGAVLGPEVFVLRYFSEDENDRLVLVNLGLDCHLEIAPEPLLAPPLDARWETLWSSEDPRYGGAGMYRLDTEENWRIPGHAAVVLHPVSIKERKDA